MGSEIELDIGGKHEFEGSIPLTFGGCVKLLYDGRYVLKGVSYGRTDAFVGKIAVISSEDSGIVVTSKTMVGGGAALFDALKMDVSGKKAIALKVGRGAFDFPVSDVISVCTPGWCAWELCPKPFKKVRRPLYPLDPM